MFKEIGQLTSLMRNLPKLKEQMEEFQEKLAKIVAEGQAGGDMVTAKINGKMQLLACRLSDEALRLDDREMLEDLIVAAVNQAIEKVQQQVAAESSSLAGGLGLPGMPPLGG